MVVMGMSDQVAKAVRMSASIENSGQCTALRHVLAPDHIAPLAWTQTFNDLPTSATAMHSLQQGEFAALLEPLQTPEAAPDGYVRVAQAVAVRVSKELPVSIKEHWRQVFLDVTSKTSHYLNSEQGISEVCGWLNSQQPISLSVNGSEELGLKLWERSGVVVFTSGTLEEAALSCQARPQDGECFGELPPRSQLTEHTRFPMVVPSAAAIYNASYTPQFLMHAASLALPPQLSYMAPILHTIQDQEAKGYCLLLLHYLFDACQGPWEGRGARTSLYGLQRPPLLSHSLFRITECAAEEDVWPFIMVFLATSARSSLQLSIAPLSPVRASLQLVGGERCGSRQRGHVCGRWPCI